MVAEVDIPLDFPRIASVDADAGSRLLSGRAPCAGGVVGLWVVGAAFVAAPIRRTTHDEHRHHNRKRGIRQRMR